MKRPSSFMRRDPTTLCYLAQECNLTPALQILTGVMPHYELHEPNSAPAMMVGELPIRPHGLIDDPVWELLEKCWSRTPRDRPQINKVHDALSGLRFHPKVVHANRGQSALSLHIQSIKPSLQQGYNPLFRVKLQYQHLSEVIPCTDQVNDVGEYTWFAFRPSYLCYHR